MNHISNYELELMKIIWSNGGTALYAEIVAGLSAKGDSWTKNTIITLLSRLIQKGLLKANKIGQRNKYIALVSESDYQSKQTIQFLDKVFEGNATGLISTLIEKDLLLLKDFETLKKYWNGSDDIK